MNFMLGNPLHSTNLTAPGPSTTHASLKAILKSVTILLALCTSLPAVQSEKKLHAPLHSLRQTLLPFTPSIETPPNQLIRNYQKIYGLNTDAAHYSIGTIALPKCSVVVQYFRPSNPRATILSVHGYYDHSGLLAPLINELLKEQYAVVALDLPGHGLSGGKRAAIDDFSDYGRAVQATMATLNSVQIKPLFAIGHSTGCAALLEYAATTKEQELEGVVFVAPLVRSAFWSLSKCAHPLLSWKSESARWYRRSSSDRAFLAFLKDDPLGYSRFPIDWSSALFSWEKRTQSYSPLAVSLLIVQGDKDETVDWRYNLPFLTTLFPNSQTIIIPGGRHHLLNESPPLRRKAFEAITRWVDGLMG